MDSADELADVLGFSPEVVSSYLHRFPGRYESEGVNPRIWKLRRTMSPEAIEVSQRALGLQELLDRRYCASDWFVFPYSDDHPPVSTKGSVNLPITLDISVKLRSPIGRVAFGLGAMNWATVPKTPIDKHGHPLTREDNVWVHSDVA